MNRNPINLDKVYRRVDDCKVISIDTKLTVDPIESIALFAFPRSVPSFPRSR